MGDEYETKYWDMLGLTLRIRVASLNSMASGLTTRFLLDPLANRGAELDIVRELPAIGLDYDLSVRHTYESEREGRLTRAVIDRRRLALIVMGLWM